MRLCDFLAGKVEAARRYASAAGTFLSSDSTSLVTVDGIKHLFTYRVPLLRTDRDRRIDTLSMLQGRIEIYWINDFSLTQNLKDRERD